MNLANRLTIVRVALIPVFMLLMSLNSSAAMYFAAALFIAAAATDKLDGYIARSRNQVTTLGKFMDPLADKLLVTSALVYLVQLNMMPGWMAVVIIAREFIITGLRAVAASEGIVIAASYWGKLKTAMQIVAISLALLHIPHYMIFFWIAVIITILSGVDYTVKNISVFKG